MDKEIIERQVGEIVQVPFISIAQKGVKLGDNEIEVIASNSKLDRHGEVVEIDGLDISKATANGLPVFYGHDYEKLPIGRVTKIWKRTADGVKNLFARMRITEATDFAKDIWKLIQDNILTDVSIGGRVLAWNDDYSVIEKMELLEISVVGIGAHPDAKIIAKHLGKTEEQITDDYKKFAAQALRAELNDTELMGAIETLEKSVAVLKGAASELPKEKGADEITHKVRVLTMAKGVDAQTECVIRNIKLRLRGE